MELKTTELILIQSALMFYARVLDDNRYNTKGSCLSIEVKRLADKIHSGVNPLENEITLCKQCHEKLHRS